MPGAGGGNGHWVEHLGSQFALEIEGVTRAYFTGVDGLGYSAEVVEHKATDLKGKPVIKKIPGQVKYEDITLKRGLSSDKDLTEWMKSVLDGKVKRVNGSIVVYNQALEEVDRFNFENGWPSKWSGGNLDAGSDSVMIEEMTISHELLVRVPKGA